MNVNREIILMLQEVREVYSICCMQFARTFALINPMLIRPIIINLRFIDGSWIQKAKDPSSSHGHAIWNDVNEKASIGITG